MKTEKIFFLPVLILSLILQILQCHSINAQSGWIIQPEISSVNYSKIKFINSQTGFLVGQSNKIFKTTNAGAIWTEFTVSDSVNDLRDIFFINQTTGFIAGGMLLVPPLYPTLYVTSVILKTTDAGGSWVKVFYDTNQNVQKHFSVINFSDENTGYAGGGLYGFGPNYLYKSTNGGNNWTEISYGQPSFPQKMNFHNNLSGVTVLYNLILKTADAGQSWQVTAIASGFLYDLFFVNNLTGYASGGSQIYGGEARSIIMKTTDSGNSWQTILNVTNGPYNILNSIFFTDVNTGYSVGSFFSTSNDTTAIILKTTNQGAEWGFQNSPPGRPLISVQFLDVNTGFAAGKNGVILKTTDGGGEIISGIGNYSNEIPNDFVLYQNYPNPFNPSTVIRYSLIETRLITLKVYNALGNEVATLVNEKQNAGSYEVKFNAANFASGIYFYKLQTEGFTDTKRMVLLK